MSKVLVEESSLSAIASAIRTKTGGSTLYKPSQMAGAIADIPTGITPTGTISITQNGTVDVTNYAYASVNVSGGNAYTMCKAIHGDGGCCIDTGIKPQSNTWVAAIFTFGSNVSTSQFPFGCRTQRNVDEYSIYYNSQTANAYIRINTDIASLSNVPSDTPLCLAFNVPQRVATINGGIVTATNNYIGCNNNIYLMTFNQEGTASSAGLVGDVYSFVIGNGNSIVMDLIPHIRNSDLKPGFIDIISGQFFTNIGSGTMTAVT